MNNQTTAIDEHGAPDEVPPLFNEHTIDRRDGFDANRHGFVIERTSSPADIDSAPAVVLPPGHKLLTWPLPLRRREIAGVVQVAGKDSFLAYLFRYVTDPKTLAIYANAQDLTIDAQIDHHEAGVAGANDHNLLLKAKLTPIMERWKPCLNKFLNQDAFVGFVDAEAAFFEDGATLLSLATNFAASETMNFQSVKRQVDGTFNLIYSTEMHTKGEQPLPEKVRATIQVYEGGPLVTLVFKLRYRVDSGKLCFQLYIPELADILRREFDELVSQIADDIHEHGTPDWQNILVISGVPTWEQPKVVAAVEHNSMPLPTPLVAPAGR